MTIQEFISKWNGKPCKALPNNLPPQCFDLVAEWTNTLGIPHYPGSPSPFPFEYAYQIYANFSAWHTQHFVRVENGLFNAPDPGDIIVWKPGYNGGAGHTGIAASRGGAFSFTAFVQNDPLGTVSHLQTYGYGLYQPEGIYGWLHPKVLDKLTDAQKVKEIVNKIETQISDTDFRNWVRELLKR